MDKKRYNVYYWDRRDQENYFQDYDRELCEDLEENRHSVTEYGECVGRFDTEDEAYDFASKYSDSHSTYDLVSIYDAEERKWFN